VSTRFDRAYRRIARSLSNAALLQDDTDTVGDADETGETLMLDKDRGRRFLDHYGTRGLRVAFERYGLIAAIERRGFTDIQIETRVATDRHELLLSSGSERLVEIVVRRDILSVPHHVLERSAPAEVHPPDTYRVLTIDWLSLQNPRAPFSLEKPRLPGQEHPGLGIGWRVMTLLARTVERLELDGFVTVAEYLHNAELYAREMPHLDPREAGRLSALLRTLRTDEALNTAQASWAMEWGLVYEDGGDVARWRGELQVAAEHGALRAHLTAPRYRERAKESAERFRYVLDRSAFDARWKRSVDWIEGRTSEAPSE
jgi:hypothetical protein